MFGDSSRTRSVLASPVRRGIIATLDALSPDDPDDGGPAPRAHGLTAAELSTRLDLHVTTIRFHLDQLVDIGVVRPHDVRAGVGRPKRHYAISPDPLPQPTPTDLYRLLFEGLDGATSELADPSEAGWQWAYTQASKALGARDDTPATTPGEFVAKLGALIDLLGQWGYSPDVSTADQGQRAELALTQCPLRHLAETNLSQACSLHEGVLRGALDSLGEPDLELGLHPFAQPQLCVATITRRTTFAKPRKATS